MKKLVIVINGSGGVGKDTLCNFAAECYKVKNISSITPIKEIARSCGWDGTKDDKSRKFLSDLKMRCVEYNDYPTKWAISEYESFLKTDEEIMFVHIREPEEIAKFVAATGGIAKTLLIRGGERMKKECYGNYSDDGVENYVYDRYFLNDGTLGESRAAFCELLSNMLGACEEEDR